MAYSINNNSTEKCISITPSLESTGSFKGKCCRVTRIYNPLYAYKKLYGDDWKKIVCKANKLDTNLTENEILNKLTFKKSSFCTHFINNEINIQLYSLSLETVDGNIIYNCGDGEQYFNCKTFVPSNDYEKKSKDMLDCGNEFDEKTCYKTASKLKTNDVQCCWCETTKLSIEGHLTGLYNSLCYGYPTDGLNNTLKTDIENQKKEGLRNRVACSCLDKNGKTTNFLTNSMTSEVIVE